MTDELVNKIAEFAKAQERFSDTVLGDTRRVMEMADSISAATSEQMITTVDQINEITQSLTVSAQEIASSAEEINAQTEALNSHIEFFKVSK